MGRGNKGTKEDMRDWKGLLAVDYVLSWRPGYSCGDQMIGGVPPRFKTERQKQMWLRLKAKTDAKNKTD